MAWTKEKLDKIWAKLPGQCHLCGGKIARGSYGKKTAYGWQVEHLNPKAKGGAKTHLNNLALLGSAWVAVAPLGVWRPCWRHA